MAVEVRWTTSAAMVQVLADFDWRWGASQRMVTQRERKLLEAAEEVCAKWSVIQAADGRMGAQGLPTALRRLARALDQYDDEEALADKEKAL